MPLVHDFVPIDAGFEALTAELVTGDHDALSYRLGLGALPGAVAQGIGYPRFHDETLVLALRLKGSSAPFERLDADVRVERVVEELSHLTLAGSYEAAVVSRRESVVTQRLVESWVRAFLVGVAGSLVSDAREPFTP